MTFRYLIIGGGMTADAAAKAIRAADATGSIGVISAELDAPYKRPPLSKGLWTGSTVDRTDLGTHKTDAMLLLGRTVTALDVDARTVSLDDGRSIAFEYRARPLARSRRCPAAVPWSPTGPLPTSASPPGWQRRVRRSSSSVAASSVLSWRPV